MPIVMAQPAESLNDAMGMASIDGRAVLVAMLDPQTDELQLLHVTVPQTALTVTKASMDRLTMSEFFEQLSARRIVEFRVKFWKYTAVAHKIPTCTALQSQSIVATRYSMQAPQRVSAQIAAETSR